MAAKTFTSAANNKRVRRFSVIDHVQFFTSAAITAAADKQRQVVAFEGRIIGCYGNAKGAGNGAGSTVVDVNINDTTVFKTATKLTIATADTGMFDVSGLDPANSKLKPGDVISIDCDSVPAVAGHTGVTIVVVIGAP